MGVVFDGVADVEGALRLDVAGLCALAEGDAVHDVARLVVDEFELDVFLSAPDHLARAVVIDALCAEDGFRVARPEGGEAFELAVEARGDVLEVDDGVDVEAGAGLLAMDVGGHELLEASRELGHVLHLHRQAGGIGVSAEVLEQVGAALHGLVDVESRHRAGRACGDAVGAGQHDAGAVEQFGQARGHDADDALVPRVARQDDGAARVEVGQLADALGGLFGDLLVEVLAGFVVEVDARGAFEGGVVVLLDEQLDGLAAVLHAS